MVVGREDEIGMGKKSETGVKMVRQESFVNRLRLGKSKIQPDRENRGIRRRLMNSHSNSGETAKSQRTHFSLKRKEVKEKGKKEGRLRKKEVKGAGNEKKVDHLWVKKAK